MKRFLSTSVLVFGLLSSPLAYGDDYSLVREYMTAETKKNGATLGSFARQLRVSRTTVYNFLNNDHNSPKLLKQFKSRLPNTYQEITTPKKQTKKAIVKIANLPVKKLNFEENIIPLLADRGVNNTPQSEERNTISLAPFNSLSKISKQTRKVKKQETVKAPIMVAYREEGDGKGAFFDHFTIQKATDYPTEIAAHPRMRLKTVSDHIKTITYALQYGTKNDEGKTIPNTSIEPSEGGLLVIPGRARANEFDTLRKEHEDNLIRHALLRGQPILAICAGSWRLWESFGGSLINVEDHCYGGGMIRITHNGRIGYNVPIHDIAVTPSTMLSGVMKTSEDDRPSVNSLHWKAPSSEVIPDLFVISARAVANDEIAPNRRQADGIMKPDEDIIEAFESRYGSPLMGIQWHPEAYSGNDSDSEKHKSILKYMAKAGTAYRQKRQMLKELEEITSKYN